MIREEAEDKEKYEDIKGDEGDTEKIGNYRDDRGRMRMHGKEKKKDPRGRKVEVGRITHDLLAIYS